MKFYSDELFAALTSEQQLVFISLEQVADCIGVEELSSILQTYLSKYKVLPSKPFTTDGCSWSTDAFGYCCCVKHDLRYWLGGTWQDKFDADEELLRCTSLSSKEYATIQHLGVRIFAQYWMPFNWRWGYGWDWPHCTPKGFSYYRKGEK